MAELYEVGYGKPPKATQFQKGRSGNPGGLPQGTAKISVAYLNLLALTPAEIEGYEPRNAAEKIALEHIRQAMTDPEKRTAAIKEIIERTEGKVEQTRNINKDVVVRVVYEEPSLKRFGQVGELPAHSEV